MTDDELLEEIEAQRSLMITVSTGGYNQIQSANPEYKDRRRRIRQALENRGIDDPNPFFDLWRWHGKWSSGDLPNYQSRRVYVGGIYDSLIANLQRGRIPVGSGLFDEPTGWAKVDRGIDGIRSRLETASNEEEFQAVGLLCRETLISLAQAVYNPELHVAPDETTRLSETDANGMLKRYLLRELPGSSNEEARRFAKAALDLANSLQHKRTASFRDACLCAEATTAVVNVIAIVSGRRDPELDS